MKKSLFILAALCLLSMSSSFAAIWRVNGNTGISANFTDVPAAITAANNGDTILVEPMNNNSAYSGVTVNKRLVILGNGYFNDASISGGLHTMNTGLQANNKSSSIANVTFYPGGEYSVIMGINTGSMHTTCSDVTIKRCLIGTMYLSNMNPNTSVYGNRDSINISQCYIYQSVTTYWFSATGGIGITDVNMQNNVFYAANYYNVSLPVGISGYFQNNVFDNVYGNISLWGFQISNNILVQGSFTANNSVYFNNISVSTQFGNANNNQQNVSTTSLFTNYAFSTTSTTETRYTLSPTGPGIGAGFNGVNVGIFGGPDPYKLSGIPPIPAIYSLSAPATTTSTTLPVTISTRSND